jgi:hypothetical protein
MGGRGWKSGCGRRLLRGRIEWRNDCLCGELEARYRSEMGHILVMKLMKRSISRIQGQYQFPSPSPSRNACPEHLREYPESEC